MEMNEQDREQYKGVKLFVDSRDKLVPHPGRHLTRYAGVLANAARWRRRIVPNPRPKLEIPLRRSGARYIDWANLLRRVFLFEVLACACGGTRRVIAAIESGPVARKILTHLGLPADEPRPAPARLDQGELFSTGPPDDLRQLAQVDDLDQRVVFDVA